MITQYYLVTCFKNDRQTREVRFENEKMACQYYQDMIDKKYDKVVKSFVEIEELEMWEQHLSDQTWS